MDEYDEFRELAAKSFGKFKDSFLAELHSEILSHAKQEATGSAVQIVAGITVHDSDILEPEPIRQGGLLRKDAVGLQHVPLYIILTYCPETYLQKARRTN